MDYGTTCCKALMDAVFAGVVISAAGKHLNKNSNAIETRKKS